MSTWQSVFYMVIWGPRLLPFCGSTSSKISKSSIQAAHEESVEKALPYPKLLGHLARAWPLLDAM